MKKLFSLLLCLLLVGMVGTAMAVEHEPGDEFTITLGMPNPGPVGAAVIWYDASSCPLTCTAVSPAPPVGFQLNVAPQEVALKGRFGTVCANAGGLQAGPVGYVTFKVNEDAKPGPYTVNVWGENDAAGNCYGTYTFTIPGCIECIPDAGEVTKAPTCKTEGERTYKCTECGKVCKTEVVGVIGHDYTEEIVTLDPTCTEDGVKTTVCTMCGEVSKTEPIEKLGHKEGEIKVIKEATCVEPGSKQSTCTVCGTIMTDEVIPELGHIDDEGTVTTEPACEEEGTKTYKCTICEVVTKTEPVPAVGHKVGESEVTKAPTCTEPGLATGSCTVCGKELENTEIPAPGHKKDEGTVTTEPTCTTEGVKTYKCSVCGVEMETAAVEMLPHTEDEGTVTTEPTCVDTGVKTCKCSVCGKELRTEEVPALGHVPGEWVIVKPAEGNEDGLKELYCTVCDELIETAVIPGTIWYHMTVSSIGPRFRDVTDLTNKWNMFTVVDLSADGEQTFDLIAGDMHVIGTMTVKVAEGKVTVTYKLNNSEMSVKAESLSIVSGLDAITSLDELPAFNFGEEISIADQLGGDTMVVIYVKNVVHYPSNAMGLKCFIDGRAYTELVEAMMVNAK